MYFIDCKLVSRSLIENPHQIPELKVSSLNYLQELQLPPPQVLQLVDPVLLLIPPRLIHFHTLLMFLLLWHKGHSGIEVSDIALVIVKISSQSKHSKS